MYMVHGQHVNLPHIFGIYTWITSITKFEMMGRLSLNLYN